MKCQHCGSTDIIAIQGQNYCLNCGYAVAPPTTPVATQAAPPSPVSPPTTKPSTSGKNTKPAPSKPAIIPSTPARRPQRQTAEPKLQAAKKPSSLRVHPLRFSVTVALAAAVVSGGVTAAALWFNVDSDTGVYIIVATVVGLGILISLAHTALLYGRSRSQDGRPADRAYWWMAARSGFMDVVNVQLSAIIAMLILLGTGLAVWQAALRIDANWGMLLGGSILVVVNLLLIWTFLGVYTAARLATPAVVVGGLSAAEAMRVGWRLYLRAGGHLAAAAVEALFGRAIAAVILAVAGYAAITKLSAGSTATAALVGGAGVALVMFCACMLILEVDTKLWLTQYRHLAMLCSPSERARLLTGRVQSQSLS